MTKRTFKFLSALCAVLIAAALFFEGGWLFLHSVSVRADGEDDSSETVKEELILEDMISNKIDNISYDVTFNTQGGNSYFCNTVPMHDHTIVLEADTITSQYSSQGASYGLAREYFNNNWSGYFYQQGGAYYHYGADNSANIFQNGKHTEVEYVTGSGPVIKVDGETQTEGTQVAGAFATWADADANSLAAYFGYCSNGMAPYSAELVNFKFYDKVTNQDLGITFYGFDATVTRFAEVGKTITVTPVTFGTLNVSRLQAIGENGNVVALDATANDDGSWSFTMPSEAVTVRPVYSYEGYSRLEMPDTLISKLDNVSYLVQYDIRTNGYIANKRLTDGDITMQYYTVASDLVNGSLFGWGRMKDLSDYAYSGNTWFTLNLAPHWVGYTATLHYSTEEHAFSLYYDGSTEPQAQHWVQHSAGTGGSNEAMDAAGAQRIGFAWNQGEYSATLRNFKMMDADGWDLGLDLSASAVDASYSTMQRWAETGKTVTLKSEDGRSIQSLAFVDDLGAEVEVAVTANADGSCSFTMPGENVTVKEVGYAVDESELYGSWYNAETNGFIVLGENESYLLVSGAKTNITGITADTIGNVVFATAEASVNASYTSAAITYNGKTYAKLGSYTVTFDLDGGTGESAAVTVNSGDYTITAPADPAKQGYTFAGWKTSEGETFDFDKPVTADVTLKAQWTKNVASSEGYYGTYYNAATNNIIVLGETLSYTRVGSTETEITSFTVYEIGEIELVTANGTETATVADSAITYNGKTYTKLGSYTVTFDLDGGTGESAAITVNSGDYTITAPADPAKEGYTFAGWKTSEGETFDFDKPVTADVTLKAQWTAISGGDTETPGGDTETPDNTEKSGCGSEVAVTGAAAGALLLGAAAILTLKKRKTHQ